MLFDLVGPDLVVGSDLTCAEEALAYGFEGEDFLAYGFAVAARAYGFATAEFGDFLAYGFETAEPGDFLAYGFAGDFLAYGLEISDFTLTPLAALLAE